MSNNLAAVLVGIIDEHIILTKRSSKLRSFAGHISFAGGKYDQIDHTLEHTAIREFNEEIMFDGSLNIITEMQEQKSVTNNMRVLPFIAKLEGNIIGFNSDEVEKIILLPVDFLNIDNFKTNKDYPTIKHNKELYYANEKIWGLTAQILYLLQKDYKDFL